MADGLNLTAADHVRLRRIDRSPILKHKLISGKKIIYDNLEAGIIKIYEQTHDLISDRPTFSLYGSISNGVVVAEADISPDWQGRGVFIHKVSWEAGYESLIEPVIEQILHFSDYNHFYAYTGISKPEYEKCLPYTVKTLSFFRNEGSVYGYCTDEY